MNIHRKRCENNNNKKKTQLSPKIKRKKYRKREIFIWQILERWHRLERYSIFKVPRIGSVTPMKIKIRKTYTMVKYEKTLYDRHTTQGHYWHLVQYFIPTFFFNLSFTALLRIFYLYRADHSSNVGENRRTRGKTTWPSISRTWLSHMWPERGSHHSGEKPNGLRVNSPIH